MKIVLLFGFSSVLLFLPTCKSPTTPPDDCPTPLDTTSHSIQWQVDTLGAQGLIRDVWVFSRTNAWAVGEIYLRDSAGNIDQSNPYNAARWDGVKWTLLKIMVRDFGDNFFVIPLHGIFGLSPTSVWLVSPGSLIQWDGQNYVEKAFFLTQLPFDGQVAKVWGTSESNIFCVGRNGSIYRFHGSGWVKMQSGTTVDLEDIWGIEASNKYLTVNVVWATGTTVSDGRCVVLQYSGSGWSTIYNNVDQPNESHYGFSSMWSYDPSTLYLVGQSDLRMLALNSMTFTRQATPQQYEGYKIRGKNQNDVFIVGAGGEIQHFNGVSWYLYPEMKGLNNASRFVFFYTVYPIDDFVVVGGQFFSGFNGFPVVVRGYR